MGPTVDLRWLEEHTNQVILVDARWYLAGRSARDAYVQGPCRHLALVMAQL
jgi:hypothetical protein